MTTSPDINPRAADLDLAKVEPFQRSLDLIAKSIIAGIERFTEDPDEAAITQIREALDADTAAKDRFGFSILSDEARSTFESLIPLMEAHLKSEQVSR